MTDWKFEMGEELKDTISGFKGCVVGRSEFITGCHRYLLQPKIHKKDKTELPEAVELDASTLKRTRTKKVDWEQEETGPPATQGKSW